jgi:hypothetical protein
VRLRKGVEAQEYLAPLLASAGLPIHQVRPVEPTLEDVFVALVDRKEKP